MRTYKVQLRGNCQCCGRQQAVVKGIMSKHGYTVEQGWFSGVCQGNRYMPMQEERSVTDKIVSDIRNEVIELKKTIERLKSGKTTPKVCIRGYESVIINGRKKNQPKEIPFEDGNVWEKEDAVKGAIWRTEQRIKLGEGFAKDLESVANEVHGEPLLEVKPEEAPAPILSGDKKKLPSGTIVTVKYKDGARVYWTKTNSDGRVFTGWSGTQAWRKYENV